jgi:hypothetical protein
MAQNRSARRDEAPIARCRVIAVEPGPSSLRESAEALDAKFHALVAFAALDARTEVRLGLETWRWRSGAGNRADVILETAAQEQTDAGPDSLRDLRRGEGGPRPTMTTRHGSIAIMPPSMPAAA